MGTDKRMDMSSMGDYNGVVGKNPVSRHQYHKDSVADRPYFDKVRSLVSYEGLTVKNVCLTAFVVQLRPSVVVMAHYMSPFFKFFKYCPELPVVVLVILRILTG